jgi:hypothetical protein
MRKYQKKPPDYPWLTKIISYRILSIPLGNWLLILLILLSAGGFFVLVKRASTVINTEIFVAEVDERWTKLYVNKHDAYTLYFVRLRRDEEEEITCTISPILIHLWQDLEVGRRYEFSANHTLNGRCHIYEVIEINESGDFEF